MTKEEFKTKWFSVLILIVMEHALGAEIIVQVLLWYGLSLNPYCNGTCSRR